MTPAPSVAIVVLNWNNFEASDRCIRSLNDLTYPNWRLVLVDNGSTDGSLDRLVGGGLPNDTMVVRNGENLGFSAGCNRGIKRAIEADAGYILLLNNDCVAVEPGALEPAVQLAESDASVGIVGGKILYWPGTDTIWSAGGEISWTGERYFGMDQVDRGQLDGVAERGFVSGALMLIKRSVVESLGPLPEAYFFGHEDWEYSLRARRLGYRVMYDSRFVVAHEAGHSHAAVDPFYLYNDTLGKILFKKRNLSRLSYATWRATYGAYLFAGLPWRARFQKQRLLGGITSGALRRVMLQAWRDASGLERITSEMLQAFKARASDTPR